MLSEIREGFSLIPRGAKFTISIGIIIISVLIFLVVLSDFISPFDPAVLTDKVLVPPNVANICGTDTLGRDIFSRIVWGTRVSLAVALIATSLSLVIGVPIGLVSGYFGQKIDRVLCLFMDALYAFPTFIVALSIVYVLGSNFLNTGLAVGIAWVPRYYKIVRSVTISAKELTFIEATRAIGASNIYIMFHHILRCCLPSIAVLMTLGVRHSIIMVAALGFLGLGVPPPTPEWGTDLSLGRLVLLSGAWWPTFFPGMMIFITVLGFSSLCEGLNVILNPKYKVR